MQNAEIDTHMKIFIHIRIDPFKEKKFYSILAASLLTVPIIQFYIIEYSSFEFWVSEIKVFKLCNFSKKIYIIETQNQSNITLNRYMIHAYKKMYNYLNYKKYTQTIKTLEFRYTFR